MIINKATRNFCETEDLLSRYMNPFSLKDFNLTKIQRGGNSFNSFHFLFFFSLYFCLCTADVT